MRLTYAELLGREGRTSDALSVLDAISAEDARWTSAIAEARARIAAQSASVRPS